MAETESQKKKPDEGLSEEQKKFLQECEEDFKDRYTDKDKEFTHFTSTPAMPPPVVHPWYPKGGGGGGRDRFRDRDNRGGDHHHHHRDHHYRGGQRHDNGGDQRGYRNDRSRSRHEHDRDRDNYHGRRY